MDKEKVINLAERKIQRLGNEPQPTQEVDIPDFISPPDISQMNDAQLEQLLNLIRIRRMTSALIYERTQKEKAQLSEGRAREQLEKKAEQVWNELNRVFNNLDKLELRVNELRALRIQAGLEW